MRKSSYSILKGIEWEGLRVRTSTHRLLQAGESLADVVTGKCVGTIAWYAPGIEQYFVVFDDGKVIDTLYE